MKKRILSCTLAVALIATTGTVTFAKDDAQTSTVIIEKLEAEIGKMNVPEQEKTAILEDLQQAKSGDASKSEKASESLGSRIKNFFKKHWGKVLGIGAAVAAVVIAVATIFTVRHCRNGSNEQEIQNDIPTPTENTDENQEIITPINDPYAEQKKGKHTEQELLTIFTNREDAFNKEIGKCKAALNPENPNFEAAKEAAISARNIVSRNVNDTMCTEGYGEKRIGGKLDKVCIGNNNAASILDEVVSAIEKPGIPMLIILLLNDAQGFYNKGINELKNGGN